MAAAKSIGTLIPYLQRKGAKLTKTLSYHVVAAGFSKRGNLIGVATNSHREGIVPRRGSGAHAEATLIRRFGRQIDKIYILRVGNSIGKLLPIHPCDACKAIADKLGIDIIPVHETINK